MKYTQEITINLPRVEVIKLFNNADNLKKWQPGLVSFKHLSGKSGNRGAKSTLLFKENGREIEMIETILVSNFPDEFSAKYETSVVENWQENHFSKEGPNKTNWRTENEFRFSGLYKLMRIFMRGSFPKQSYKYLQYFKDFAEKRSSAN
jgi:hypothetical protein